MKIHPRDIALFFRQFATLLSAGIPITQCCDITASTQTNNTLRSIIHTIKHNLLSGKSLHSSLETYTSLFNPFTRHLIHLGEQTGKLDTLLDTIATHHEKILAMQKRIQQALLYPCIVFATAITITFAMLIFIIPRFAELFQQQNVTLPLLTQSIFFISAALRQYSWLALIILPMGYFYFLFDTHPNQRLTWLTKIPPIRTLLVSIQQARFARQLALSLSAGVPILDALRLCSQTHEVTNLTHHLEHISKQLQTGTSLQHAMQHTHAFPEVLLQLVSIGEESGMLDSMLNKAADILDADISDQIERAGKLAEPLIMLVLGVVIGGLVIGMYLPIFNLGNAF